jgi:hypothetical protein
MHHNSVYARLAGSCQQIFNKPGTYALDAVMLPKLLQYFFGDLRVEGMSVHVYEHGQLLTAASKEWQEHFPGLTKKTFVPTRYANPVCLPAMYVDRNRRLIMLLQQAVLKHGDAAGSASRMRARCVPGERQTSTG